MKKYVIYSLVCLVLCWLLPACGDSEENIPAPIVPIPEGLSWKPEAPDADQPVTLTFKASSKSALYGYTGDVYLHIGVVSDGDWMYVPADWNKNIDKCRMIKAEGTNVWTLTLSPSIRQWFGSGKTPVQKLGIVIRSADGSKKGIEEDSFIEMSVSSRLCDVKVSVHSHGTRGLSLLQIMHSAYSSN